MIGISMVLMALVCGAALRFTKPQNPRTGLLAAAILGTTVIALLTPPLWTTWRPAWLPWPIESYINGVHNLGEPQPWLFPIFPWTAFAFAGLAAGFILFSDWGRGHTSKALASFGTAGGALILFSRWLDHRSFQLYAVYDYWHTSPNFLLMRVGILLIIALLSYAWCRWGLGARGFSPLIQLGQTSLLVYWVHIEFVYGRFSLLPKRSNDIRTASLGLLAIFLMMLALSLLRTRIDWKAAGHSLRARIFQPKPAA
jgi:fucose 4-O-acetylase-like acetyltransferase